MPPKFDPSENVEVYDPIAVKLTVQNRRAMVSVDPSAVASVIKALKESECDRKKVKNTKHSDNSSLDDVIEIAKTTKNRSVAKDLMSGTVKEILGTCVSAVCTVDGKDPKVIVFVDRSKMVDFVLHMDVKKLINEVGGSKADYHGRLTISNNRLVISSLEGFLLPGEKELMSTEFLAMGLTDSESPTLCCMSLKYDANGCGYVLENYEKNSASYSFKNGSVVHLWSFRDEFDGPCLVIIYA